MVFASSVPASADELAAQRDELTLAIAFTFAIGLIGLYFGGSVIRAIQQAAQPILAATERRRPAFASGLNQRLRHLADDMDRIRQPRLFFTALFTTCFTYSSSFLTNFILLRALGVDVELPVFIAIISLGMFASAFPFTVSGFRRSRTSLAHRPDAIRRHVRCRRHRGRLSLARLPNLRRGGLWLARLYSHTLERADASERRRRRISSLTDRDIIGKSNALPP